MDAKQYTEKMENARNRPIKAKLFIMYAAFAVIIAGSAAYFGPKLYYAMHHETTDNAFVKGTVVPVSTMVKGTIAKVYVTDNMQVKKGQKLFVLDQDEYKIALAKAQEDLSGALAQIARIDATKAQTENTIQQAQAMYAKAKTEDAFAAREKARYATLAADNLVSRNSYDSVKSRADETAAETSAASSSVDIARSSLNTLAADRKAAEFKASAAQQAVKQAQLDLSRTVVYAPSNGRIGQNNVKAGRYVQPGQTVISLVNDSDIWIEANYKETQMEHIRQGEPVEIKVDAFPNAKITGHVDSIQPGTGSAFSLLPAENATGNFVKVVQRVPVKIIVDSVKGEKVVLVPGLSVEPSIKTR